MVRNDPRNFRPITMVNTLYKVLTSIIEVRIMRSMMVSGNCDDQKAISARKRGCLDAQLANEAVMQIFCKITDNIVSTAYKDSE